MLRYVIRRIMIMVPTLWAISVVSFVIIQLPPGDFLTNYLSQLEQQGVTPEEIEAIVAQYGMDKPLSIQYLNWTWGMLHGNLGRSLQWNMPVSKIIVERLPWSFTISFMSFLLVYIMAIPIGTFSAVHKYTILDYVFTVIGFIGMATPNFMLALILLYIYFVKTGNVAVGLFSHEFLMASWSLAKFWDLLKHLWIPAIVLGTAGTCGLIRIMRANLSDELQKPYVAVARAKGISKRRVLYKYPFRIAINPLVSTIGWILPGLVGGELIVSLVLNIPTLSPVFFTAIMGEDMFLAASIVFVLSTLTVIGTLISDILLAWVDPRIRESV